MSKLWKQITREEKGMALPIVLVLLLLGGLMIAPTLSYASTSLNAGRTVEENVKRLYAADAGIEHALWSIKNDEVPEEQPYPLPEENINQMGVIIEIETEDDEGIYTLYSGGLVKLSQSQNRYFYITVAGRADLEDEELQIYRYTITVTWQAPLGQPPIHLGEVGVRLPVGYSYQTDSAFIFSATNLSPNDPDDDILDEAGAHLLNWEFGSEGPEVSADNSPRTQAFYIIGEGGLGGDYTWVKANPSSIGEVGEVIGTLYIVTATATDSDGGQTKVEADVFRLGEGTEEEPYEITILLWQINPQ